ncbi:hypothetical protein TWF730_000950 [Orbilia blumenaviensis]|uniref:Uncharacterized protein n=1 Tax=Orbilia blumenaviensis TaxID=1796055 RepID=A0AAV9VQB8_9PEZI
MARSRPQPNKPAKSSHIAKLRKTLDTLLSPQKKKGITKTHSPRTAKTGQKSECPNLVLLGFQQNRPFKDLYKAFLRHEVTDHNDIIIKMEEQWGSCPSHRASICTYWENLKIERKVHFNMLKKARLGIRRGDKIMANPPAGKPISPVKQKENADKSSMHQISNSADPEPSPKKRVLKSPPPKFPKGSIRLLINGDSETALKAFKPKDEDRAPLKVKQSKLPVSVVSKRRMSIGELLSVAEGKKKEEDKKKEEREERGRERKERGWREREKQRLVENKKRMEMEKEREREKERELEKQKERERELEVEKKKEVDKRKMREQEREKRREQRKEKRKNKRKKHMAKGKK